MGVNKSELIRAFLREYPGVRTRDVVEHFKTQGLTVSQQLVASVRGRQMGSQCKREVGGDVRLSEVKAVRDFVGKSELDTAVAVQILSSFADLVESFGSVGRFRRVLAEYVGVSAVDPEPEHEDHEEDIGTGSSYIDINDEDDD